MNLAVQFLSLVIMIAAIIACYSMLPPHGEINYAYTGDMQ